MKKSKKRLINSKTGLITLFDILLATVLIIVLLTTKDPTAVQGLTLSDSSYSSASLSWKESENADGYDVYRSDSDGNYEYLTSTEDTSFTDTKLKTGKTYKYTVTTRNGLKTSEADAESGVEVKPELSAPDLKVDTSAGVVKLEYSSVEGATGYEIVRDGETIAQSEDTSFEDETANNEEPHSYEVKAYRYKKDPVYSDASNKVDAELHCIEDFTVEASDKDLVFDWADSEYYQNYKIYNGDELLGEGSDTLFRMSDFDLSKTYDIKLVGYSEDNKVESPTEEKRFRIVEEEMTNEEAREAACDWAEAIAADDSFTYGSGARAHRYGCYFCGTNVGPNMNIKGSSLVDGHSYEKTYCCNPFVHAAFAHGAGDENMLRDCQRGKGIAMSEKSFTRYGHWEKVGKPAASNLQKGDVLVKSNHVVLYVGDGQICQATSVHGGWGPINISVSDLGNRYSKYTFVMRYTGTGRGVKRVIQEVDENGEVIDTENQDA